MNKTTPAAPSREQGGVLRWTGKC